MTVRVWWRGVQLDERTRAQMVETERLTRITLDPVQGSYSSGANSAGTHTGGGAIDLDTRGLSADQKYRLVKTMRIVGFAAWLRPYRAGVWREHVHAVSVGCPDLADAAVRQVNELRAGGDGLAGSYPDPHRSMGVSVRSWEQYLAARDGLTRISPRPVFGARGDAVKVARDRLRRFVEKHEGYGQVAALDPNPNWTDPRFDKGMSALVWQSHKTLARLTGNGGWRNLSNAVMGDALLARLGLTVR